MRGLLIGIAFALLIPVASAKAMDGAMTVELNVQGTLVGPSTTPGREGTIDVIGLAGGLLGGAAADRCRPVIVHKRIDQTTPLLARALDNAEIAGIVTIQLYESGSQFATLRLTDAVLVAMAYLGGSGEEPPTEAITLNYQEIRWTLTGGITSDIVCASASTP